MCTLHQYQKSEPNLLSCNKWKMISFFFAAHGFHQFWCDCQAVTSNPFGFGRFCIYFVSHDIRKVAHYFCRCLPVALSLLLLSFFALSTGLWHSQFTCFTMKSRRTQQQQRQYSLTSLRAELKSSCIHVSPFIVRNEKIIKWKLLWSWCRWCD